ncbi:DUF1622 domain-containing protein [Candidatus Margulisiibacteriota bacterium]
MEHYKLIAYVANAVGLMGVAIIVWGIILVLKDFLLELFSDEPLSKRLPRQKLGSYLVLGLEFFIAADVIRTVLRPGWNEIGMLAAIVALRIMLSSFLGRELREKA